MTCIGIGGNIYYNGPEKLNAFTRKQRIFLPLDTTMEFVRCIAKQVPSLRAVSASDLHTSKENELPKVESLLSDKGGKFVLCDPSEKQRNSQQINKSKK